MNSRCRSVFQRASALMAERQGFEPWEDISPHWFSKPARSTAPAPLQFTRGRRTYYISKRAARQGARRLSEDAWRTATGPPPPAGARVR